MPLIEHLRELRSRLMKSALAIVVGSVLAWFFYAQIFDLLTNPFTSAVDKLAKEQGVEAELTLTGVGDAFTLQLKTSLVAGVVIASPIWLWQLWAFVVPALHRNERRWSMVFAAIAGPLFLVGVAIGYYVLPKGIEILVGFTPGQLVNLITVPGYLNFVLRILLVFGVAFEIPLFVVLLNLVGVVKGTQLASVRPWIIIGVFAFAAIATPTTDPITMLFLALPMTVLFLVSEVIARLIDRRRAREDPTAGIDDDTPSPL